MIKESSPIARRFCLVDHIVSSIVGCSTAIVLFGSLAHSPCLVTNASDVDLIVLYDDSDLKQLEKCSGIKSWVTIGANSLFKHKVPVYASKRRISEVSVVLDFISTSHFERMCKLSFESHLHDIEYKKVVSGPSRKTFTMGSFGGSSFRYKPRSKVIGDILLQHHIDWMIKDNELYIGLYPEVMLSRSIVLFERNQGYVGSWLNELWLSLASRMKKEQMDSPTTNRSIVNAFTKFNQVEKGSKRAIEATAAIYSGINLCDQDERKF